MKQIIRTRFLSLGCLTIRILLLMVFFTACVEKVPEVNSGEHELAKSSKQRQAAAPFDAARVPQLVEGNTAFAVDLYQRLSDRGENMVFSPYSLSIGLSMIYAGARGETAAQIAETLHFSLSQEQLHPTFNALDQILGDRKGGTLNLADASWGSKDSSYLDSFLDILAENYGAGIQLLDFHNPNDSRQRINQWINEQTETRITDLLPPGSIRGNTSLILTNAIFFQAAWSIPFHEESTQEDTFLLLNDETIPVEMMQQVAEFRYGKLAGAQVIELPYEGSDFSMVVVLPQEGTFEPYVRSLDIASLDDLLGTLQPVTVKVSMPRFQFCFSAEVKQLLLDLGMIDAFGNADFSGVDGSRKLFIDQVYHQAMVSVDEAGTEAAGASAVVVTRKGLQESDVTMKIDHPFLFLIRDNMSESVLFMGNVLNPKEIEE